MTFTLRQITFIFIRCQGCWRTMQFASVKDYAPGLREVTHKCPECKIGCLCQIGVPAPTSPAARGG